MAQTIPRSVAAVTGVPSNSTRARHRRPNHRLAGLTGIAIVVLTAGNLGLPLSGGYLAMDVLMVCIGFETARTLRCHADQKQRLKRYWLNEVGPMIAPVLLAVGLSTLQWSLYGELDQPQIRAILGGLTMTLNLFVVFGGADFAAIEHLWAIGVIAQFLVVAPVLVWGGRRYLNANNRAAALLGAAAGVAICRLSFLLTGGVGESSIAVNTLTRADALLVGLVIGVAPLGTLRRRLPANLAAPAFAMLLLLFISAPDQDDMPRVALGLMVTAAVALSALVAAWIAMGGLEGALSKTLDNLVLQWLGHRAISIYVWHQLFGLTISAEGLGVIEQTHEWPGTWVFVARVVFSLAAAATSHRYLEAQRPRSRPTSCLAPQPQGAPPTQTETSRSRT